MKIFFTDLDDTLLTSKKDVSPETIHALEDFCHAGNLLAINSGRHLLSLLNVRAQAKLFFPGVLAIANNGSQVYDCDTKETLRELRLDRSIIETIFEEAKKEGIYCQTYTDDAIVCREKTKELAFYQSANHIPAITSDNPCQILTKNPFKVICIDLEDHEKLYRFQQHILNMFGDRILSIFSSDSFLEFVDIHSGKGEALHYICKLKNINLEDSYAAGDAENDISMIKAAGTGIAMLNGSEAVKKAATVITQTDNNHDGLAPIIRSLI